MLNKLKAMLKYSTSKLFFKLWFFLSYFFIFCFSRWVFNIFIWKPMMNNKSIELETIRVLLYLFYSTVILVIIGFQIKMFNFGDAYKIEKENMVLRRNRLLVLISIGFFRWLTKRNKRLRAQIFGLFDFVNGRRGTHNRDSLQSAGVTIT